MRHLIELMGSSHAASWVSEVTEGVDTSHSSGRLMFHIFGAIAELERQLIREPASEHHYPLPQQRHDIHAAVQP
jgi:DNA invertase Pin-like site-specific DNA recombinase